MAIVDYGPWTKEQAYAILACRLTSSVLTILGALFIIFSMIIFKKLRKLPTRLIFWMTLSSLVTGCSNLLTSATDVTAVCWLQGMVMHFSQSATFVWTVTIATNLYLAIVVGYKKKDMVDMEKYYHLSCWSVALAFFVCPLLTLNYGHAGLWCWISDVGWGRYWRFLCFYIPLLLYILYVVGVYVIIALKVWKTFHATTGKTDKAKQKERALLRRLMFYPIAFVVIWTIPIINRVQNWIDPENPIFVLYLLQAIVAPLQGFVNALIYGLDRDIRTRYHQLCCTIIGRPPPVSNSVTSTTMESSGSLPQSDYTYVQNCVALVSCLGPCDRDLRS